MVESRKKVSQFAERNIGLSATHPQPDCRQWPGPEGQNTARPSINCLTQQFRDIGHHQVTLDTDYERLVNRVELHTCQENYCKRYKIETESWECRFEYPMYLLGYEADIMNELWMAVKR